MATHKKSDAMAKQEVNSPLIITTGLISIILLVVAAMGTEAWFRYEEQAEVAGKWSVSENAWLHDIQKAQAEHLNGRPVAADQKTKTMPIDQAIDAVVKANPGKTR
jgi:hypothetical protein